MDGRKDAAPPVTLRLNTAKLQEMADSRGWGSQAEQCRALGLSVATMSRLHGSKQGVGAAVLASLIREFGSDALLLVQVVPLETEPDTQECAA